GNDADGAPIVAIALRGTWIYTTGAPDGGARVADPTKFTFACRGAALAKCAEWGYKPWVTIRKCGSGGACTTTSLEAHHQTCTRMVRADYCGDGNSWTLAGTQIAYFDGIPIYSDAQPSWHFGAEWSPDGALCVTS